MNGNSSFEAPFSCTEFKLNVNSLQDFELILDCNTYYAFGGKFDGILVDNLVDNLALKLQ